MELVVVWPRFLATHRATGTHTDQMLAMNIYLVLKQQTHVNGSSRAVRQCEAQSVHSDVFTQR